MNSLLENAAMVLALMHMLKGHQHLERCSCNGWPMFSPQGCATRTTVFKPWGQQDNVEQEVHMYKWLQPVENGPLYELRGRLLSM